MPIPLCVRPSPAQCKCVIKSPFFSILYRVPKRELLAYPRGMLGAARTRVTQFRSNSFVLCGLQAVARAQGLSLRRSTPLNSPYLQYFLELPHSSSFPKCYLLHFHAITHSAPWGGYPPLRSVGSGRGLTSNRERVACLGPSASLASPRSGGPLPHGTSVTFLHHFEQPFGHAVPGLSRSLFESTICRRDTPASGVLPPPQDGDTGVPSHLGKA